MSRITNGIAHVTQWAGEKIYKYFKEDTAGLMIFASVTGVVLAGISNTLGIIINKKTTKKEKGYLIPMEITDSVMNLATFYGASAGFKKLAEHHIKKGYIDISSAKTPYAKEGITIAATVLGSIIASNILTPIIRNNVGARIQHKLMNKAGIIDKKPSEKTKISHKNTVYNNIGNHIYTRNNSSGMKV